MSTNAPLTTSARQEACDLVLSGLESLRQGLIKYHELGLTTKEIYADLQAAGWDKSLRTLQSHQTELRKEGLLTTTGQGKRNDLSAESCTSPVENSTPQSNTPLPVTPTEIVTDDCISLSPNTEPVQSSESRPQPYRNPDAARRELTDQVGSEDYQRVIELVDDISDILKVHAFKGTFSISEWTSCLGGFQHLAAVAAAQHNNVQQYS